MRYLISIGLIALLASCGSKRAAPRALVTAQTDVPFATGPIFSACVAADRKATSRRLCGCVQAVANDRLSSSQQTKAARFFKDPHLAQVARQEGSRAFWTAYKAFAAEAEKTCKGA